MSEHKSTSEIRMKISWPG